MQSIDIILLLLATFVGVPILAFLVAKFATAGHLKAKERAERQKQEHNKQ